MLGSEEYSKLMQRRTELMSTDDKRENKPADDHSGIPGLQGRL